MTAPQSPAPISHRSQKIETLFPVRPVFTLNASRNAARSALLGVCRRFASNKCLMTRRHSHMQKLIPEEGTQSVIVWSLGSPTRVTLFDVRVSEFRCPLRRCPSQSQTQRVRQARPWREHMAGHMAEFATPEFVDPAARASCSDKNGTRWRRLVN